MNLLHMSMAGAVLILVIAVIRALAVNQFPKKMFVILWAVALARLLIPYSLPYTFSAYTLLNRLIPFAETSPNAVTLESIPETAAFFDWEAVPALGLETAFMPEVTSETFRPVENMAQNLHEKVSAFSFASDMTSNIWRIIWLTGAMVCMIFFAMVYGKCRREFRESLPVESAAVQNWLASHQLYRPVSVRQSDKISAPLTYGVFRPVILIPATLQLSGTENISKISGISGEYHPDSLSYILTHEYMHICHFDALSKLVLTFALCVHWFNPAVWLMYVLANRDMELSCDEAVIYHFGNDRKSAYARTLIQMEEIQSGFTPLYSTFSQFHSQSALEERITAIMTIPKKSLVTVIVAASLVLGVSAAFATTAERSGSEPVTESVCAESTVISYVSSRDGKTYYNSDDGKTWEILSDEEYQAMSSGLDDVEWWSFEEYEDWLAQEKINLQNMLGERAYTPSMGWFTWDQKRIDEAIRNYEVTLQELKDGKKVSKPIFITEEQDADGNTISSQIVMSYDPNAVQVSCDSADNMDNIVISSKFRTFDTNAAKNIANSPEFADYAQYGLRFDKELSVLRYHGQIVNFFHDETSPGVYTHMIFSAGSIGLEVQRDDNRKVTGLRVREKPDNSQILQEVQPGVNIPTTYDSAAVQMPQENASHITRISSDDTSRDDSAQGLFPGMSIPKQYDITATQINEEITLETSEENMMAVDSVSFCVTGDADSQIDIAELPEKDFLALYEPFGITFDTAGKMFYQGKAVRCFIDCVELSDDTLATRYLYRNDNDDNSTEYLRTVREPTSNGDGSYNPFGKVIGIVPWEPSDWDNLGSLFWGDSDEVTAVEMPSVDAENADTAAASTGEINMESVAVCGGNDTTDGGMSFPERFAQYKALGIRYVEAANASGAGNVYWNGQLVGKFSDVSPSGGAFSFTSAEKGGVDVRTVYDQNGNLVGVK